MDLVGLCVRTGHFWLHFFDVRTEFPNFYACRFMQREHMIFLQLFFFFHSTEATGQWHHSKVLAHGEIAGSG